MDIILAPNASWVLLVFIIGYIFIVFEHMTHINKATAALLTAVFCWLLVLGHNNPVLRKEDLAFFREQLADISQVAIFLLGALAIVETISVHQGFRLLSSWIQVSTKRRLLWLVGFITFFLSSILDNLTTTIVMVSLMQKIVPNTRDRWIIGSGVVIAANAGGAWTPIGDVTTTMLWIGGQLSTMSIITSLFVPSMICFIGSFLCLHFYLDGPLERDNIKVEEPEPMGTWVLFIGVAALIFVPIFKLLTGLPPFMGILFGLSILWLVTDLVHSKYNDRKHLQMLDIIRRVDLSSVIFFVGILLSVAALERVNLLKSAAFTLDQWFQNPVWIAAFIGAISAIIDNVPLVAAAMGMYDLSVYPQDASFWKAVAYAAGTGGSMLIIGSAAGVVFMGIEKVNFFWYLKKITVPALVGYVLGLFAYIYL